MYYGTFHVGGNIFLKSDSWRQLVSIFMPISAPTEMPSSWNFMWVGTFSASVNFHAYWYTN